MVGLRMANQFSGVAARPVVARLGLSRFGLLAGCLLSLAAAEMAAGQTGACCAANGACTLGTAAQCGTGVYQGNGTSCADVVCPLPTGACCTGAGACTRITRHDCQLAGSTYIGDGLACGPSAICPIGACCLNDGSCTAGLSQTDCQTLGGVFQGIATTCVVVTCPIPVGACCNATSCALVNLTLCTLFNGTWRGPNTACGTGNTCPTVGVCCRGSTCSVTVGQAECVSPAPGVGARFAAGAATCNGSGSQTEPCCYADFDGSGALSAQDIFDYLNAWFAASPYCHIAGNGLTPPTNQDIFDFLNDWFAGC